MIGSSSASLTLSSGIVDCAKGSAPVFSLADVAGAKLDTPFVDTIGSRSKTYSERKFEL